MAEVQTSTEAIDSHQDEKVEVKLRKKNKAPIERPISGAEYRLSKDFKDFRISDGSERFSSQFEDFCYDYDEQYDEPDSKRNSHMFPDDALFQQMQDEPRERIKPSKEMKAAMKVVNDSLIKYPNGLPKHLENASNIIQQEWFKISSTATANPLDVEDYLDSLEEVSSTLLEYVVNMVDNNGNTAMHYAVSHGNFDVVSILLDSKVCNINKMNSAGYTCIMLVSLAQVRSETHRQVIRRLLQLADVNIRAKQHGQTALMLAVSHGRLDMVKLLLEAGADPNIQDSDGSTALMCAAEHGHIDIVKHILEHPDTDTSIVDCDGSTALAIAMEANNREIGVLLYARERFSSDSGGSSPCNSFKRRDEAADPHPKASSSPSSSKHADHSI